MKKSAIVVSLVLLLVVLGILFFSFTGEKKVNGAGGGEAESSGFPAPGFEDEMIGITIAGEGNEQVIEIRDDGFFPKTLEVGQGDEVTWINKMSGGKKSWPASAVHPTHMDYPGSDINKCFNGESEGIFDSCGGLSSGESWSFTFNEKGNWNYHDHLDANLRGTIVVD